MFLRYTIALIVVCSSLINLSGIEQKKGFLGTVVIDPGHGGPYVGAVSKSQSVVEKHAVLEIAHLLADRLREKGFKVILTRTGDYALDPHDLINDLKMRAYVARDAKADILVSLHLNSSPNEKISGYMLFVPFEDKFPIKSYALASAIHYDISHEVKPEFGGGNLGNVNTIDLGIRAAKFNVLVHSVCPSVLVELAYLTHPETERQLGTAAYKESLVQGLCSGIRRYFVHAATGA